MTRKTIFRTLLAIRLMYAGNWTAARYCLPRKWKPSIWNLKFRPIFCMVVREHLKMLEANQQFARFVAGGEWHKRKIGDTIQVRKPARFRG